HDLPARTHRTAQLAPLASVPASSILPLDTGIESAVHLSIKQEFFNKIGSELTLAQGVHSNRFH
ncbi:hypothetical protein, partial [Ruegeria hyattellae]|uniref:hypothetical protein n=1 Tax=Ruegeria hyattellae TaxID=3233337 RepID=UPI00355C5FA0